MDKILSMADFYDNSVIEKELKRYLKYGIEFIELSKYNKNDNEEIKKIVKGYHLRFFPTWLDFYLEEKKEIEIDKVAFFGGTSKNKMIEYYRKELEKAKKLEVEYVVLHASSVSVEESLTYNFRFSDTKILEKVVKFINEIFDEKKYNFTLLLENLWWPGLKLLSSWEVKYLLERVNYKNIGFMLDTAHMINTNLDLKNSDEAVEYILKNIENLSEYKNYIYGVHLNYSLSGEYVKKSIKNPKNIENIYEHIMKIDSHLPFENEGIKKILDKLPIKYLVFEIFGVSFEEREKKIKRQLEFL